MLLLRSAAHPVLSGIVIRQMRISYLEKWTFFHVLNIASRHLAALLYIQFYSLIPPKPLVAQVQFVSPCDRLFASFPLSRSPSPGRLGIRGNPNKFTLLYILVLRNPL